MHCDVIAMVAIISTSIMSHNLLSFPWLESLSSLLASLNYCTGLSLQARAVRWRSGADLLLVASEYTGVFMSF